MSDVNPNSRSAFVYACHHAYSALRRIKNENDEIHDGCGEDGVMHELYIVLAYAINYFDEKYLDRGAWRDGVYDYEVWDVEWPSAELMYELLVYRAIRDAGGSVFDFYIGSITEIIDGYAASNGWKPGKGGEP